MSRPLLRHYGPEAMFLLAAGWGGLGVWLLDHPRIYTATAMFQIAVGGFGMLMAAHTRYAVGYGAPEVRDA